MSNQWKATISTSHHLSHSIPVTEVQSTRKARRLRIVRATDFDHDLAVLDAPLVAPPVPPPQPAFDLLERAWFAVGDEPGFLRCYDCDLVMTDFFVSCPVCGHELLTLPGDPLALDPGRRDRFVPVSLDDGSDATAWLLVVA